MSKVPVGSSPLTLNTAPDAWESLADYATRFQDAWKDDAWRPAGQPPSIAAYLPEQPVALRRMVLLELVKIDLERRVSSNSLRKSLEQYAREFPELLQQGALPSDLIYEEFHVRQQAGDTVDYNDYLRRFPAQAPSLRRLFGLHSTRVTKQPAASAVLPEVKAGQSLDEFEILAKLGEGAFAKVFLARQPSMQRRVALKVSARESAEPQTMAQLDHPNIVRVFDQRALPERGLGLTYMEYVAGGSLLAAVDKVRRTAPSLRSGRMLSEVVDEALVARGESPPDAAWQERLAQMPWGEVVCWLGTQLASALDYAHARDTLHRDLKPANILLTAEGLPKLVDFNIAYSSKLEGASPASFFGGSVGYMAPEHLEAFSPDHDRMPDELDGRSDLYSLGIVLWELLTGERPFADEMLHDDWSATIETLIERRRAGVPQQAIAKLPKRLPPGFREALLRCLAPDPQDRFATAGDAARELRLCLHPEVCRARQRRTGLWQSMAQRRPLLATCLLALMPNLLLSIANVSYDWFAIVIPRLTADAHLVFLGTLVTLIKTVLYIAGFSVGIALTAPAFQPFRSACSLEMLTRARRRSLRLGDIVFWVSVAAWLASGVIFPAWIDWSVGAIAPRDYVHFMASHALCSLVAGTLAFFLISLLAVRVVYPQLWELGLREADADVPLLALRARVANFGRLAVIVPFLAAVTLGFGDPGFQPAFAVLGVLGLALLAVTFRLSREIQADIDALLTAVNPQTPLFSASVSRLPL